MGLRVPKVVCKANSSHGKMNEKKQAIKICPLMYEVRSTSYGKNTSQVSISSIRRKIKNWERSRNG